MKTFVDAQLYTGSGQYDIVGNTQLEFLKLEGCLPESTVGEVGCGCLCGGHKIIGYLNSGNYIGIDPNKWLIDAALEEYPVLKTKNPKFFFNDDFSIPEPVDYVISHSILSHAAHWQLAQFFNNLKKSMKPLSKIIASIRLAENDSKDETWQYPGVSYFSWDTVKETGKKIGFNVVRRDDLRELMMKTAPAHHHDWVSATLV